MAETRIVGVLHLSRFDAPEVHGRRRALCDELIGIKEEALGRKVTCPKCAELDAEDELALRQLQELCDEEAGHGWGV